MMLLYDGKGENKFKCGKQEATQSAKRETLDGHCCGTILFPQNSTENFRRL